MLGCIHKYSHVFCPVVKFPLLNTRRTVIRKLPRTNTMSSYSWVPNVYPAARRADIYETFKSEKHGEVKIHDAYQWLESSSDETEK